MTVRTLETRLDRLEEQRTPRGGVVVACLETDDAAEVRRQVDAARATARARGADLVIFDFGGAPA